MFKKYLLGAALLLSTGVFFTNCSKQESIAPQPTTAVAARSANSEELTSATGTPITEKDAVYQYLINSAEFKLYSAEAVGKLDVSEMYLVRSTDEKTASKGAIVIPIPGDKEGTVRTLVAHFDVTAEKPTFLILVKEIAGEFKKSDTGTSFTGEIRFLTPDGYKLGTSLVENNQEVKRISYNEAPYDEAHAGQRGFWGCFGAAVLGHISVLGACAAGSGVVFGICTGVLLGAAALSCL